MASERTWEVLTASNGQVYETNEAIDSTYYTYSYQKVSNLLYFMKEALVNDLNWHVVSSSYRTDDNNPTNAAMTFSADTTDGWITGSGLDTTGSIAPCDCTDLVSGGNTYYNAVTSSGVVGRSWILLKHSSSNLSMQENSNNYYHMVLDFASNTTNPSADNQTTSVFGNSFNIIVFPKAPTNPAGTPSPKLRPHDPNEMIVGRASDLFIGTNKDVSTSEKLYVLKDTFTDGFIFLIGGGGKFKGFFAMNTFSDHPEGQAGKVFTMGYSQYGNNEYKLMSANAYASLIVWGSTAPTLATSNLVIRGVSSYDSNTSTYTLKPFVTCIPAFTTSSPVYWMVTYLNKKTLDNSYIEWPLPVLDISSVTSGNYRFKGRIPDIKFGPSTGLDGLMSKPTSESTNYDRVLLSGLWFPWNSSEDFNMG